MVEMEDAAHGNIKGGDGWSTWETEVERGIHLKKFGWKIWTRKDTILDSEALDQ